MLTSPWCATEPNRRFQRRVGRGLRQPIDGNGASAHDINSLVPGALVAEIGVAEEGLHSHCKCVEGFALACDFTQDARAGHAELSPGFNRVISERGHAARIHSVDPVAIGFVNTQRPAVHGMDFDNESVAEQDFPEVEEERNCGANSRVAFGGHN